MNPFFSSSVEDSSSSFNLDPSSVFLTQSSLGLVESNVHTTPASSVAHPPPLPPLHSHAHHPAKVSSQAHKSASLEQTGNPSPSSISLSSLFSDSSRCSLLPSGEDTDGERSFFRPSTSSSAVNRTADPTPPSTSASFFGGSGSGLVSSFFHPNHIQSSRNPHGFLPHPLAQPYQLYGKHPYLNSPGARNFFQSPFPMTTAHRRQDASENTDLKIEINNVVAVFSVRCHLDLKDVAMRCVNVVYRGDKCVVVMKLRNPWVTCRIWSSGKITCTGAPCEEEAKMGCRRVARILSKLGYNVRFSNYRIVNILATCILPYAIKLVKFTEENKEVNYEPELHPGASLRFPDLKVNMRVFSTGSITITAPKVPSIQEGILRAYKMVYKYRNDEEEKTDFEHNKTFKRAMSIVPLLSQSSLKYRKAIPKGPFHSRHKQQVHREHFIEQALHQVRTGIQADDFMLHDIYDSDSDFSD